MQAFELSRLSCIYTSLVPNAFRCMCKTIRRISCVERDGVKRGASLVFSVNCINVIYMFGSRFGEETRELFTYFKVKSGLDLEKKQELFTYFKVKPPFVRNTKRQMPLVCASSSFGSVEIVRDNGNSYAFPGASHVHEPVFFEHAASDGDHFTFSRLRANTAVVFSFKNRCVAARGRPVYVQRSKQSPGKAGPTRKHSRSKQNYADESPCGLLFFTVPAP